MALLPWGVGLGVRMRQRQRKSGTQQTPGTGAFLVSGSQPPLFPATSRAKKKKVNLHKVRGEG